MAIRVLVAEDHLIVRQGLKVILEREGLQIVGEAPDGHQAIELAGKLCPDVAVLDFDMPLLNGIDAGQEIVKVSPSTKIILLTMYTEDQYVLGAIKAGIRGFVVKTQAVADLVQAIREVSRGSIYLSPGISQTLVQAYLGKTDVPSDPLTPGNDRSSSSSPRASRRRRWPGTSRSASRPLSPIAPSSWRSSTSMRRRAWCATLYARG